MKHTFSGRDARPKSGNLPVGHASMWTGDGDLRSMLPVGTLLPYARQSNVDMLESAARADAGHAVNDDQLYVKETCVNTHVYLRLAECLFDRGLDAIRTCRRRPYPQRPLQSSSERHAFKRKCYPLGRFAPALTAKARLRAKSKSCFAACSRD